MYTASANNNRKPRRQYCNFALYMTGSSGRILIAILIAKCMIMIIDQVHR